MLITIMAFPLLVFLMLSGFGASIGNWTENVCKNLKTKHNHLTLTEEATNFKVRISNALCKKLPFLRITKAKLSTTEHQKLSFLQDITDYFGIGDIMYFNAEKSLFIAAKSFWLANKRVGLHSNRISYLRPDKSANVILNLSTSGPQERLPITKENVNTALWIIYESESVSADMMESLPLNIKIMVFTFKSASNPGDFVIQEVFKPYQDHSTISNVIGHWSNKRGLSMSTVSIWERRNDLKGLTFRVAILPGHVSKVEDDGMTVVPSENNHVGAWKRLSFLLNFTSEYVVTEDGAYGSLQPDGTINGMIGKLARNEADAAIHGIGIFAAREKFAQPLSPITTYESGSMYRKKSDSEKGSIQWSTFYAPLHPLTWLVGVLLIIFLSLGEILSYLSNRKRRMKSMSLWQESLPVSFYGPLMQGNPSEPDTLSGRILFLAMYIIGWFIWASHSSMLTAHLSVKVDQPPFTSLLDLLYKTDYRVLFLAGDGEIDIFKQTDMLGIYLQKNSSFTNVFNHKILSMIQTGYIDKLLQKYNKHYKVTGVKCDDSSPNVFRSNEAFGTDKVVSLYVLLAIGIALSILTWGMELLSRKKNKK